MSVVISRSELALAQGERAPGPPCRPRVEGEAALVVAAGCGQTGLVDLHQRDPLSVRLPRRTRGDILEACVITTSGGLVGGDRLAVQITASAGSRLRAYPQAAEKVYRSLGSDSRVTVTLRAESGTWLEWLPQETIVFDGARLRRETSLSVEAGARAMAGEILVLGRRASGERLSQGLVHDGWRVNLRGKLAWADAFHASGDLAKPLASSACLRDVEAFATFIYAADDAPAALDALRLRLGEDGAGSRQALTSVNGLVVARFLGEALAVRRAFGDFWAAARHHLAGLPPRLPQLWHT